MTIIDSQVNAPIARVRIDHAASVTGFGEHQRCAHAGDFANEFSALLIAQKLVDHAAVDRALRAAQTTGERLDQVLTKLGLVSEADVANALSKYLSMPLVTRRRKYQRNRCSRTSWTRALFAAARSCR